jgi:hypothetical protein
MQEARRVHLIECDTSKIPFLCASINNIKEHKLTAPIWGGHAHITEIGATATSSQGVYLLNSSLEIFFGGEGDGGGVGEGNRDGNGDGDCDGKGNRDGDVEGNRQGKGEGYIVN